MKRLFLAGLIAIWTSNAVAQHDNMPGTNMNMPHDALSDFLMQQASGTSMNPSAAPMHMAMTQLGD